MSNSALAKRYAKALFDLAKTKSALERVYSDLNVLAGIISESAEFNNLLKNPVIAKESRANALDAIAKKTKCCDLTRRFLKILAANSRAIILNAVIRNYSLLLNEHKGQIVANVTSATALLGKQISDIEASLGKSLGKKVKVSAQVDDSIIGGLIVKIGSRMVDASISGKLSKLQWLSKNAIASF